MDFNARQLKEDALIKKGRYPFRVVHGKEKRSAAGNEMMNLKIALQIDNRETLIWDTLMLIPKMFWKVEHFCHATGISHKLEEGRLMAQDCDNLCGELEIDHRVNKDTGQVEDFVKDYVQPESGEFEDDEVPNL